MEMAEEIRRCKRKKNENMQAKQITKLGFIVKWIVWKIGEKRVRTQFTSTWTLVVVEMGDRFHHDFQVGL